MIEPKTDRQLGDGDSLQYESLRFRVLEKNEAKRKGSLGLALFIRQGMLAWLEALYICASQRVAPAEGVNTRSIFAYSPQSEMTKILANITLFALGESES